MADKIRVVIVDDIAETREQLRKLLSFDPSIDVVALAANGEEAVRIATEQKPHVMLMDINMPGMDGITATGKIMEQHPAIQVIMLSVQGETDYMRRAMMAGARDFLTKPPSADELLDAIQRAYKAAPKIVAATAAQTTTVSGKATGSGSRTGRIISIFSPKGGVGCTSIAVNLALALHSHIAPDGKVALMDANLQFGDTAIFLKIQPTRTLIDLATRTEDLDLELLNTILAAHPSGLRLLSAPASPEEAEIFNEGGVEESGANRRIKRILEFTQQQFDYLIVDLPHAVDGVTLAALDVSDLMLVVTRPVIPEIRGARIFIELLQKINYAVVDRIGLVINGVDNKRMGIQPEAIERAMMPALVRIPLDERVALRAANYGVPFVIQEPRAAMSLAITSLAQQIHERYTKELVAQAEILEEQKRIGLGRAL